MGAGQLYYNKLLATTAKDNYSLRDSHVNIAVAGLWHLGTVTAGCLAAAGHQVVGIDEDRKLTAALQKAEGLPVAEPGLKELIANGIEARNLRFTNDRSAAMDCEAVWITYDTPVDENDVADVDFVIERAAAMLTHMPENALLLISSQLPVGSTARLERRHAEHGDGKRIDFIYTPENLRLGKALDAFCNPDRVIVGARPNVDRQRLAAIWAPYTDRLVWMSIESAEMTKHALNAFLATSVAFINEIGAICEHVGADVLEVERGLKSDARIGPGAYLHAGGAFSGGTLARDIEFLRRLSEQNGISPSLIRGVKESNDRHKNWTIDKLRAVVGELSGSVVAILGLTYKPGTDTLRRSAAVEMCHRLAAEGTLIRAYDPAVRSVPDGLPVHVAGSAEEAICGADAAVIATAWPEFLKLEPSVFETMRTPLVIDPTGFLKRPESQSSIRYFSIGRGGDGRA